MPTPEKQPRDFGAVDRLFSIEEAADQLKLSRSTIYLEIAEGRIKVHKARNSTRIKGADIQAYIDSLRVVAPNSGGLR